MAPRRAKRERSAGSGQERRRYILKQNGFVKNLIHALNSIVVTGPGVSGVVHTETEGTIVSNRRCVIT